MQSGELAEDIQRLQRCINDLVGIVALPAMWSGGEPSRIVDTLLDALLGMLDLNLVYVRLKDPDDQAPIEMVRFARSQKQIAPPHEIGDVLKQLVRARPSGMASAVAEHLWETGTFRSWPWDWGCRVKLA